MPPRIQNVATQGGIGQWYSSLPPITRLHATCGLALMLAASLVVLHTKEGLEYGLDWFFFLHYGLVFKKLQVWRLVTSFLYVGTVSFPSFLRIMWLVQYGTQLESGVVFGGRTADYAWMYVFAMITMLVLRLVPLWGYGVMGWPFVTMIVYLWSRYNATAQVSIMGLVKVQGFYLPFAFMAVDAISKPGYLPNGLFLDGLGIVTGHLYYFLREIEPRRSGRNLVQTPMFMKRLVHKLSPTRVPVQEVASASHPSSAGFRAFQGSGRRLTD